MANVLNSDPDALRKAADKIGNLIGEAETTVFGKLDLQYPLEAGNFSTAHWICNLITDRLAGMALHTKLLKAVFQRMQVSLKSVADELEKTDGGNAKAINQIINTMKDNIEKDLDGLINPDDKEGNGSGEGSGSGTSNDIEKNATEHPGWQMNY